LKGIAPSQNVKLAWSLAPDEVIRKYEHRTPSLEKRLSAVRRAARDGWPIRLCFDPVIPIEGWQKRYQETITEVFEAVPPYRVEHVAVGPFRVNETYFKRMKQARPRCDLFYRAATIDPEELEAFVEKAFGPFIEKEKIALWKPPS
jgi:spore photoproduct lyase